MNNTTAYKGTTAYAFPALTYWQYIPGGASQALMWSYPGDYPRGTPVSVTHYGQQMNFLPIGDAVTNNNAIMNQSGSAISKVLTPMIRYD